MLYRFLLNKWYSDEIYDVLLVRPALWLGRMLWKKGDEGTIDRFGPDGAAAAVVAGTRITARIQTGYLYTYALGDALGRRRRHHLGDGAVMAGFPILSAILALPLLGALACLLTGANGARWIALLTTLATLALCLMLWGGFQVGGPQWQYVEYHALFAALPGRSASTASP